MIHQYLIRVSEDEVAALEASGDIPAGLTSKRPLKFYMCMGCRKVFWKGPKYESARQHMASVMQLDVNDVHDECCLDGLSGSDSDD
eukprot:CAMPEP_0113685222 /NCGR_PEP_ID=MMETSP0038_2-20120614/14527_1 /TAXON_ID=2898 /ORGANISM="Cryptomonas paramecium" /LENGTH=85 /DNA_ID=CAMNT_0000605235 /DNA_START=828 /DNA_END=1085 /DNA_ORIENTATION=+ /assembly_acc=CAM_ASM_000170